MFQIAYPTNFVLLRGNHETKAINFAYGFREELENRLGKKDGFEIWEKFNEVFSFMPLACLVGGRILCMHGGISEKLESLDSIDSVCLTFYGNANYTHLPLPHSSGILRKL